MKIVEALPDFHSDTGTVVTSGTFDGVHIGHQQILQQVVALAVEKRVPSVVLTFWPHPRYVLGKSEDQLKLLTTFDEKAQLIEAQGIDYLVKLPFTRAFSNLSPEDYVQKILQDALHTQTLIIGYDHHFGKNRAGDFDFLTSNQVRFGFELKEIPKQEIDDVGISSTKIRQALQQGKVTSVIKRLGRPFALSGRVVKGDGLGRTIDFPTANIEVAEAYKLIPAHGVYAVKVLLEGALYDGMLNIGVRPTIGEKEVRIEVNIFNFKNSLYGKRLEIRFYKKLRDEQRFLNIQALKTQLLKDREGAIKVLKNE